MLLIFFDDNSLFDSSLRVGSNSLSAVDAGGGVVQLALGGGAGATGSGGGVGAIGSGGGTGLQAQAVE